MKVHESAEMYLETILILTKEKANVRSIDIVTYMGYSKPSVSRAVGLLKKDNFITIDDSGYITLTTKGKKLSEKIYERHIVLSEFLISLGIDKDTAVNDACKIEHIISDKSFEKIKKSLSQL